MVKYFAYAQSVGAKWQDWSFRTVSQAEAERLVKAGEAETVTRMINGAVELVGYRAKSATSWEKPSPCTLTLSTMIAVGNNEPQNKKARLSRREREHVEKFKVWPLIGDTKAIAVRPRISDAERKEANSILSAGYMRRAA